MSRGRVLIVEDSEITVTLVSRVLEAEGWDTHAALSGREAFEVMGSFTPDVLVCDLHMPEMDGFAVIEESRQRDVTLPVVVLSGDEDLPAVLSAVRYGAFDYVVKSKDDLRPLCLAVERAARHGQVLRENRRLNEDLKSTNAKLEERVAERTHALEQAIAALRKREEELQTSQAELRATNVALEEASRQKNEFLAQMSHELRTPLNAIVGFARIVNRKSAEQLDERQAGNLRIIQSSAQQLLRLVNDMLDFQKIESGSLSVSMTDVECGSLAEDLRDTFMAIAAGKGIALDVEIVDSPITVRSDLTRLRQAIENLVSNAIKYSDGGTVRVEFRRDADSHGGLRVSVSDEGLGIAPENLGRIFEAFHQVEGATRGGAGLGLAIVEKLAALIGGRIEVQSEPGRGSTFSLVLPEHSVVESPQPLDPVGHGPVVLVVDDDLNALQVLGSELSDIGFRVHMATSGQEGLVKARELKPDAVLLDIIMPGVDGWQVLRELRRDPTTCAIPVFITSVLGEVSAAQDLGVSFWLTKPITGEAFRRAMQRVLKDERKDVLVVEGDPATRALLEEQLTDLNVRVRTVGTAEQALAAMEDRAPDAVILDLVLPDVGVVEVLDRLRKTEGGEEAPVVVYTGKELTAADQKVLSSVLTRVIRKHEPHGVAGVVDAVRQVIDPQSGTPPAVGEGA